MAQINMSHMSANSEIGMLDQHIIRNKKMAKC